MMGSPIKRMRFTYKCRPLPTHIPTNTHTTNIYMYILYWHSHADRPTTSFFVGSRPGADSDPDTKVQRSKSLFSQVYPLLFIHETERKGGRDSERQRERRRNPPAWGLWCGKQNLLFNLPSNGIHMTLPELVRTVCRPFPLLFVCVFTCLRLHVSRTHTWYLWCPHVCEIGGEKEITCNRLKLTGGEWTKKILVIAPCCCSIALPEK